ncbi:hypothetical protein EW026_g4610 [Hermanssonia centrifuga]|uniref:PH domain-containing protein n=1 Tax=Hermanssonia centrifuga TaxID=98765 RepID=A0A4S4KGL1_9APHY|nr:hypothetical protein EW026_g4610 [Hermanssonia centrifuga]
MMSPAELRVRRMEAANQRDTAEHEVVTDEAERQARLKLEKEMLRNQMMEEENRRKRELEEELRYAAVLRSAKEAREKREEEERRKVLEERRKVDRERRLQQTKRLQEWRDERAKQAEDVVRRKVEMRQHIQEERRSRPVLRNMAGGQHDCFDGWVTIQIHGSVTWRRRFCRVQGGHMRLFKDTRCTQPLDTVPISSVQKVKECSDGCEELEGLPFSFALDLSDGSSYSMFTDCEEEKELLMSLIIQIAKL